MRAIIAPEPAPDSDLQCVERPDPECADHEVLIAVSATAINRADLLQRRGFYPPPPGVTDILGLECAGVIERVGSAVTNFAVGDEVCALLSGGGYAEKVAVPATHVLRIPDGVPLHVAAGLPEVVCTAWSNLTLAARLQPGESVLIHGGSGGVGSMAIQLAKQHGAKVFTTAGSDEKVRLCHDLGADLAVNYRTHNFVDVLREHTTDGVDVVLDIMGAKYVEANLKTLAVGGRLVIIGLQGGVKGEVNLGRVVSRRLTIQGTSLRWQSDAQKTHIVEQVMHDVWPWFSAGTVTPVIDRVLDWSQVAAAHEAMASCTHQGKIILTIPTKG